MKNLLKKMKNREGFTLAELLIVVAIIAVLVAISIPIFSAQLEKSRDAVSVANMRTAYAEAQTSYLTCTKDNATSGNATVTFDTNGTVTEIAVANVTIKSKKADNWSGLDTELPFKKADGSLITIADPGKSGTSTLTIKYDANGAMTAVTLSDPA